MKRIVHPGRAGCLLLAACASAPTGSVENEPSSVTMATAPAGLQNVEVEVAPTAPATTATAAAPAAPSPVVVAPAIEIGVLATDHSGGGAGILAPEPYLAALEPLRNDLAECHRASQMGPEITVVGTVDAAGLARFEALETGTPPCLMAIVARAQFRAAATGPVGLLIVVSQP